MSSVRTSCLFRSALPLGLMCFVAACTTTNRPGEKTTGFVSTLTVCPGPVSNSPATDRQKRIVKFDPVAQIRGAAIARAPVQSCLSSGFGPRGKNRNHEGIDLFTRTPVTVVAGGHGVIEKVGNMRGYGKTILIRHNRSVKTRYAHLSSVDARIKPGLRIKAGDKIGRTGRTGNATAIHLHYEILVNGKPKNPLTVGG